MPEEKIATFVRYTGADVYFIFSFCFDFHESYEIIYRALTDLGWNSELPEDRRGRPPFLSIERQYKSEHGGSPIYLSTSLCRELIKESTTTLVYSEVNKGEDNKETPVQREIEVGLNVWARLFNNGAGTITFRISLEKEFVDFRQIQEVLSLSERLYDKERSISRLRFSEALKTNNLASEYLKTGLSEFGLYKLFVGFVRGIRNEIASEIAENLPDTYPSHREVPLVLQDEEIMNLDGTSLAAQNPYVMSVVEVEGMEDDLPLFQEPALQRMIYKELATILFRLVYTNASYSDVKKHISSTRIPDGFLNDSDQLSNFAWDTRLLMSFSQTSSLFACRDTSILPAVIVKNSLLDILEVLRTRWHMSIMINAQLDKDLEEIKLTPSDDSLQTLARLIRRRKRFASFLRDPLPYALEGGSVSRLQRHAAEEMQLPELRQMTIEKFAVLDRLFEDQSKYIRLTDFDGYLDNMPSGDEDES